MRTARIVRMLGLFWVLALAGLAGGCGPGASSPAKQEKFETAIQQERKGRHQELKEATQSKQGAGRKAAHRGP
jgi:hypothetical protein